MPFVNFPQILEPDHTKSNIDFGYKMSDHSGSGDQSKEDKKREYNRLAQREFRKRRKEHLKRLEEAQKGQVSEQGEIIERLQQQNAELYQEIQSLRGLSQTGSASRSPHRIPVSSPLSQSSYGQYDPAAPGFHLSASLMPPTATGAEPSLIFLAPHTFAELCTYVYSTSPYFSMVLEQPVHANPQSDLVALATMSQSLLAPLRPTETQLTTPHHAYLDLLPSPSLRDKLIRNGPQASTAFIVQISTSAGEAEPGGAITIWGHDLLSEQAWEFSAGVLERWGWLLGREWGQRANFWRHQRTAPLLPAWEA